ncbi:hypothetical protein P7C73_g4802, partial [Tremellales sp. Uapishka_1]
MLALSLVLTLIASVSAQLTVTEPSAAHWWVGNSQNTLAWTGSSPTEFSVFLYNPNTAVLTSKLALESIINTYQTSLTINPGGVTPSTGYVIQLTDILNSSNIYAASDSFEIKAEGSTYPAQTTPGASASASTSGGTGSAGASSSAGSSSSTASASTSAKTSSAGRSRLDHGGLLVGLLAAVSAFAA